jgi:serine/threonine-protein kinase
MPYVEGETLRDRIDRERQLPVDEALRIATAVGNALDHAHRHKVIHRDIKPGNILLQDGEPVVADFGIALAVGAAGSNRLTETGLSLGTPYYMSPEQATGDQAVGASTDTYALGSVLYEMLVGEPPYPGATAQAVLGRIISGKPVSATEERPSVPANVDAAVRKALERLPADRFGSAQEFVRALADEHFRYGEVAAAGGVPDGNAALWRRTSVGLAAMLAVTLGWVLLRSEASDPPGPPTRISVHIPEDQFFHPSRGDFDLSADGSLMVYLGVGDRGQPQLWVRRWDELDATPVRDAELGARPAISPDGQEVAFAPGETIRIVPLQAGVSRTLTERAHVGGGQLGWSPDGVWIYYTDASGGLSRLPSRGGTAEIITEVDAAAGDELHRYVDVLPGNHAVYTVRGSDDDPRIQAVDVETGEVKDLVTGRFPRYSTTGHLLFQDATGTTLFAAPFDVDRLELTGAPLPLDDGLLPVGRSFGTGLNPGNFAVSRTGRLVYRRGSYLQLMFTPVWVDRDGTAREIDPGWGVAGGAQSSSLSLSSNGTRLALSILNSDGGYDLWVKQLDAGPLSRLTFEGLSNRRATWSPDGQSLTFVSGRAGQLDLWTKRADGTGEAEMVLDRELQIFEGLYSRDGTWLVFREGSGATADIYAIRTGTDSVALPLVTTEFSEHSPALSPDGRWLAYVSGDTGRDEVYVRPFPDAGSGLVQVSGDGGVEPVWSHSGQELFYRNGADELVAVQVSAGSAFAWDSQNVLFSLADYLPGASHPQYAVSPDDQQFVMLRISDQARDDTELILVDDWFEGLRERMGN